MKKIILATLYIVVISLLFFYIINGIFQFLMSSVDNNGDMLTISEFININKILIIPFLIYLISLIPGLIIIIKEIKKRLIKW